MFDIKLAEDIAKLSKLHFSHDELKRMTQDMKGIISLMDKVKKTNNEQSINIDKPVSYQDLRQDYIKTSYPANEILKNATDADENSFVVPKLI